MNRNDSVLEAACKRSGLSYEELKFPIELTLWIDPEEVNKNLFCLKLTNANFVYVFIR